LAPPTSATDSGLWVPTPCATDARPITGGNLYVTETGTVRHMRPDGRSSNRGLAASAAMWPTPNAGDAKQSGNVENWERRQAEKAAQGINLQQPLAVAVARWPTPKNSDHRIGIPERYKGAQSLNGRRSNLNDAAARMWRTPTSVVTEPKSSVVKLTGRKPTDPQVGLADQVGGKLNPTWVEWLMGWPIGWTDLKPSAMDKCPGVQPQPGACSLVA